MIDQPPPWYFGRWFHGTDSHFPAWQFPPPPKQGEAWQVAHKAVFFTQDQNFAGAAGKRLAATELLPSANVLDAHTESPALEQLRREVLRNPIAALSVHINDAQRWLQGWRTGEVLRFAFTDPRAEMHLASIIDTLVRRGAPRQVATVMAMHNTTRGLIELICESAKRMGYDALAGSEVDQHKITGARTPKSWLAVFNSSAIKQPDWIG